MAGRVWKCRKCDGAEMCDNDVDPEKIRWCECPDWA